MAVKKLKDNQLEDSAFDDLNDKIKREILRPDNEMQPPGAPVVAKEESGGFPAYFHYYVIWDQFNGVDDELRSKIVYQAVKEAISVEEALKTTIAMGLTTDEATALGITPRV